MPSNGFMINMDEFDQIGISQQSFLKHILQKRLLQLVGSEEAPERLVMQTECSSIGQGLEPLLGIDIL